MDPTACLTRYQDAAARSDWSEAEDAAEALALWIARGGCFPRQWGAISHTNGLKLARFQWADASRRAEQAEFEEAMAHSHSFNNETSSFRPDLAEIE